MYGKGCVALYRSFSLPLQLVVTLPRTVTYTCKHGTSLIVVVSAADLDSSGDGKLSHHELEKALTDLDIDITPSQATALVQFMGKYAVAVHCTWPRG